MVHDNQVDKKHFVLENKHRIEELKCASAFKQLNDKEKLYAHYFSQASRCIGLVALIQSSPEAPLIYSLLHRIFKAETPDDLKAAVLNSGVSDDDFTAFLVYTSGFFANAGNYKGAGDTKFVPNLNADQFEMIVKSSRAYKQQTDIIAELWSKCKKPIFHLTERTKCIGLGNNGITTYFSGNCTKEDSDRVTEWLQMKNIVAYNSRAFKIEANGTVTYEIKLASSEVGEKDGITQSPEEYKGHIFVVTRGDYAPILKWVNKYLGEVKKYAANDNQVRMIENYIKHFAEGNIHDHKEGSRYWIKDKGPVIETYFGYIAPYRDPAGIRSEFNSLVSMVNKEASEKFTKLVDNAEHFLEILPWNKDFEKDVFLKPDFTALEMLSFDGAMVPSGISIPPYEDIRQNEGFKNVSLENVIIAHQNTKDDIQFLSQSDQALMKKYKLRAFEVQVGLHELLGHGSGKLLSIDENGKYNFDVDTVTNPLTNQLVNSWYQPGETYVSKFGSIGPSYEECRAESIALYLDLNREILSIFGITEEQEIDDIIYVNYLWMVWAGVVGLELYDPLTKKWLQAHTQARYVIMQVLLQAGQDFVDIKETEDGKNLLISVDRTKIKTVGRDAIHDFLLKLQIYKSTGDIENGAKLYSHYSTVSNDSEPYTWENWRDTVLEHKKPKPILVQANTELQGDTVTLKSYEASLAGYIESCIDRFRSKDDMCNILESVWEENKKYFPSLTEN